MGLFSRKPTGPTEEVRSGAVCLDAIGPFGGDGCLIGFEDGTLRWEPSENPVYVDCGHASGLRDPESQRLSDDYPASILFSIGDFRPVIIAPEDVPKWKPWLLRHNSRLRLPEEGAVNPGPTKPEDLIGDFDDLDFHDLDYLLTSCKTPGAFQVWGERAAEAEKKAIEAINEIVPAGMRARYTVKDYEKALEFTLQSRGKPKDPPPDWFREVAEKRLGRPLEEHEIDFLWETGM